MSTDSSSRLDTSVPHPARRYDYWLGGKDNFAADRESGDAIAAAFPAIRTAVQENRGFLRRAVTYLTKEVGWLGSFDKDFVKSAPVPVALYSLRQAASPPRAWHHSEGLAGNGSSQRRHHAYDRCIAEIRRNG